MKVIQSSNFVGDSIFEAEKYKKLRSRCQVTFLHNVSTPCC